MFDNIVNPQNYNQRNFENWTQWKLRMWDQTGDFLLTLTHFKWISPFHQMARLLEDIVPAVLFSEKCEPLPGMQFFIP